MYKARLQELCLQRTWPAPEYAVGRDGPDHNPSFRASVAVNGVMFDSAELSRSAREAQNKAAQVAVEHFAVNLPPKPLPQPAGNQISYKSQLHIYSQKSSIDMPKYDTVREGYVHAPRFKASVRVGGQTFYSQRFFSTSKEAENDAANVALLSFPSHEKMKDESNFYKNLLQEFAQKESISMPMYKTFSNGEGHMPVFSSTVEVGGESFMGEVAKCKKQAEMNAAKVAWFKLKERYNVNSGSPSLSLSTSVMEHQKSTSSGTQSKASRNVELPKSLLVPISDAKIKYRGDSSELNVNSGRASLSSSSANEHLEVASSGSQSKANRNLELSKSISALPSHLKMKPISVYSGKKRDHEIIANDSSSIASMATNYHDYSHVPLAKETMGDGREHIKTISASLSKLDAEVPSTLEGIVETTISRGVTLAPSSASNHSDHSIANLISESPIGRVVVYPCKLNIGLPQGSALLPCSDDLWVAVSLDLPKHADQREEDVVSKEIMVNGNGHFDKIEPSELGVKVIEGTSFQDENSESDCADVGIVDMDSESDGADVGIVDMNSESQMGGVACSLECNRVRVFPNKPGFVLPQGASRLPFSDDEWISVSFNF